MPIDERTQLLKRNIIGAIILAAFIPAVIVFWIVHIHLDAAFTALTHENLQGIAERHSLRIDSFIEERGSSIVLAAADAGERLLDPEFFRRQLHNIQRAQGNVIVDMGLVGMDGRQVVYAGPLALERADYSQAHWFKDVASGNGLTSSGIYISDAFLGLRGSPHFIIALPLRIGEQMWIFRATVDFADFSRLVADIRVGEGGKAAIINRLGEFQTPAFTGPQESGRSLTMKAERIFGPDFKRMPASRSIEENDFIYAMAPLKDNQWMLVVRMDRDEAYILVDESRRALVVALVLVSMAMLGAGTILSWRLLNRIERLEREREALNEHLIQAGKLSALGEMAAGIAHEINNPVAIMLEEAGWIEDVLADMPADENTGEVAKSVNTIKAQGGRCRTITHKLLGFARKSDEPDQAVQLQALLREVVSLVDQKVREAELSLSSAVAANLPPVRGTPSALQQIFFNLLNNAVDATRGKGSRVRVEAEKTEDGQAVLVRIKDDGTGIPDKIKENIFDPFFTTKAPGKGTGLGLSICYGIVKGIGGEITVDSREGEGTVFNVRLPIYDGTA